jgi:hypothetical protein
MQKPYFERLILSRQMLNSPVPQKAQDASDLLLELWLDYQNDLDFRNELKTLLINYSEKLIGDPRAEKASKMFKVLSELWHRDENDPIFRRKIKSILFIHPNLFFDSPIAKISQGSYDLLFELWLGNPSDIDFRNDLKFLALERASLLRELDNRVRNSNNLNPEQIELLRKYLERLSSEVASLNVPIPEPKPIKKSKPDRISNRINNVTWPLIGLSVLLGTLSIGTNWTIGLILSILILLGGFLVLFAAYIWEKWFRGGE